MRITVFAEAVEYRGIDSLDKDIVYCCLVVNSSHLA